MPSKITGILDWKRELTPCSTRLTSILKERKGKRYNKFFLQTRTTSRKAKTWSQKFRTWTNCCQSWPLNNWKRSKLTWTESSQNTFKKYLNRYIFKTRNILKTWLVNTLSNLNCKTNQTWLTRKKFNSSVRVETPSLGRPTALTWLKNNFLTLNSCASLR